MSLSYFLCCRHQIQNQQNLHKDSPQALYCTQHYLVQRGLQNITFHCYYILDDTPTFVEFDLYITAAIMTSLSSSDKTWLIVCQGQLS